MKLQTKVELRNDCKDLIVRLLSTSAEEGSFLVLIRTAKANISASMCRLVVNQLSGAFTTTDLGLSKLLPDPRIKYNNLLVDRSRCLVFLSSNIGIELITLRSGSLRLLGRIPYIVENGRLCFDQYRGEMLILTDYIRCAVIAPHLTEDGERFPIAEPIAYYRSYWTDLGAYDGSNPLEPLFDGQPVHEYHRVTPDYTAYCVSTKETRCVASFYQFGDQPPTFTKVNVKWEGCAIVQRVYYHQYKGSEPIAIDFDADGICYCLDAKTRRVQVFAPSASPQIDRFRVIGHFATELRTLRVPITSSSLTKRKPKTEPCKLMDMFILPDGRVVIVAAQHILIYSSL